MAIIKVKREECYEGMEKREPFMVLMGMETTTSMVLNITEVPQKIKSYRIIHSKENQHVR
jgi:hypothetical protein